MRLLPLLLLALLLAGCGSSVEKTGVPASSGEASASGEGTASGPGEPAPEPAEEPNLKPPAIVLMSRAGEQRATHGSYCVESVHLQTGMGQAVCSDSAGPIEPERVSTVSAGEEVTLLLEDAILKADSTVTIRPLGCDAKETTLLKWKADTRELPWEVTLEPGAYQVDVFALFKADDGRTGDVSGSLGLDVVGSGLDVALTVRPVDRTLRACP